MHSIPRWPVQNNRTDTLMGSTSSRAGMTFSETTLAGIRGCMGISFTWSQNPTRPQISLGCWREHEKSSQIQACTHHSCLTLYTQMSGCCTLVPTSRADCPPPRHTGKNSVLNLKGLMQMQRDQFHMGEKATQSSEGRSDKITVSAPTREHTLGKRYSWHL